MLPFPKGSSNEKIESVAILTCSPEMSGACNENTSAELGYLFSSPASAKHKTSNMYREPSFTPTPLYFLESNCPDWSCF